MLHSDWLVKCLCLLCWVVNVVVGVSTARVCWAEEELYVMSSVML